MQAGPAKANELFAKLADTSDGAIKTREKLFTELKEELELHTSLEEQYLFPVLKRNAETKELVGEAIKDNKILKTMLSELERMPKNDEAFAGRIKEMQKAFKQHARDEKRELLPAVQHALSEEQIHRVEGKMEAAIVDAERTRHEEKQAHRVERRQEKEAVVQPVEQITSSASQATEAVESNVVKMAETITTAADQVAADAVEKVSSPLTDAAQDMKNTIAVAHDSGSELTQSAKQIAADRAEFSQQVFWSVAERQLRFAGDMTKWWIRRYDSLIQIAMAPFTVPRP